MTWAQAVDEALRRLDRHDPLLRRRGAVAQRFTPRRKGSNWSAVNIANVERLTKEGRMRPAGLLAFVARTAARTGVYSYEQRHEARLTDEEEARFRSKRGGLDVVQRQPQAYRTGRRGGSSTSSGPRPASAA